MKKILVFCLFISGIFALNAQTIDDILKVSYQEYEGTARFAAMGGAFGALGGDISGIGVNPAGVAVFRKTHASFTSSLNHIYNNSVVGGIQSSDSYLRAGISSFGVVCVVEDQSQTKWNFGLTYLKKNNFNRRTAVKKKLNERSIIDYFEEKANSFPAFYAPEYLNSHNAFSEYNPLDWDVVMAYGTYLIDWGEDNYLNALENGDRVYQQLNSLTTGSSRETTLEIGMNHNDKFFAGILLGMTKLNYRRDVVYQEYAHENNTSDFDRLAYNTSLKIRGSGVNCKIGIIYKPVQPLRFGLSFHSPDYFISPYKVTGEDEDYLSAMDNLYSASMEVQYKSNATPLWDSPGEDYYLFLERLSTPYKAIGSFAFIIGKLGLVSMDCEYVDYSRIKLKGVAPTNLFNSDIKTYFKNAVNMRFGAEMWVKNFALRAGYVFNQSPDKDYDLSRQTYSTGLGWKFKQFNLDFAYVQTNTTDYYTHYTGADRITENLANRRFSVTFGWTFDEN
ncbi:MAG: hypothetical protein LBD76_08325 [Prevotellaceae bacterium]|jgi:hypothetical protein|nr:hypothetical protein [Prevotellaceae bacterium]